MNTSLELKVVGVVVVPIYIWYNLSVSAESISLLAGYYYSTSSQLVVVVLEVGCHVESGQHLLYTLLQSSL